MNVGRDRRPIHRKRIRRLDFNIGKFIVLQKTLPLTPDLFIRSGFSNQMNKKVNEELYGNWNVGRV
jgi:hypothetical protein